MPTAPFDSHPPASIAAPRDGTQLPGSSAFLAIVQNEGSGAEAGAAGERRARLAARLEAAGRRHAFFGVGAGADVSARAREAVDRACQERGIVVAAGGDGTINAVAQAAWGRCAMGVLPQGTFNFFAREHGLTDDDPDAVLEALLQGSAQPIQAGRVNDRLFLVNASVGLYPQLLEQRERWKAHLGRSRFVAMLSGLATMLGARRAMHLQIGRGADPAQASLHVRTMTLFVGNSRAQLAPLGVAQAELAGAGHLVALLLKPIGRWRLLRLLMAGAWGRMDRDESVASVAMRSMTVSPAWPRGRAWMKVGTDGEVVRMRAPLRFEVAPEPLWWVGPALVERDGAANDASARAAGADADGACGAGAADRPSIGDAITQPTGGALAGA